MPSNRLKLIKRPAVKQATTASDPQLVKKRLAELRPILANAVVGDFSKNLKIPEEEDEFTELFVGVQMMQEVIREQLQELRQLNQGLEAKAAERTRALEEAQALTHLGSWEWDIATGTIAWSDELYRIYGLKPQEREIGFEEFMAMIHADDRARVNEAIGVSYQMGKPFAFEHRITLPGKKERTLYGMGKVIKDSSGKPIRMVGTSQDITERKKSELALRQSDERFSAVTQATHDLVYDLDLRRGTIWFNEALQSEYGYRKDKVDNTMEWWMAHMHPDDASQIKSQINKWVKSDEPTWYAEHRFQKADGTYAVVRNSAFVIRDQKGKSDRIIGSFLDITRQRQLDRAKDEFISLVSHQLRTPLTIIRLYGNMLTDGVAGPVADQQQPYIQKITNASTRLIKLVGDILNISRLELNRIKIEPTSTDVNELIKTHLEELTPAALSRGVKLEFNPQPKITTVQLDATVFGEIVHNLVSNGVRYAHDKNGKVRVELKKERRGYLLTVRDNGIGIPRSDQPHIFERFYRANNAAKVDGEGTGLGLYLVKLFTDTAGGKIWFKSTEGKGTTFSVLFPSKGMKPKQNSI